MRYFYWVLIGLAVLAGAVLLLWRLVHLRRKWACKRVKARYREAKIWVLNEALAPFGFMYEPKGDLITSGMYPWQREMGYCRQYDEAAPLMNMIFQCEPIYFEYDGKRWLLELWKGQYGCNTGAEIGLYVRRDADEEEEAEKLFYECAEDEERIAMQFVLYYGEKQIMERRGIHWWLTGFCPGLYSRPEELELKVRLYFPDCGMQKAFCDGLLRAGYRQSDFHTEQNCVSLSFLQPKTQQPQRVGQLRRDMVSRKNRRYCRWYCRATRDFDSTLDKITFLGFGFPLAYRLLIRAGRRGQKRKLRRYRRRSLR